MTTALELPVTTLHLVGQTEKQPPQEPEGIPVSFASDQFANADWSSEYTFAKAKYATAEASTTNAEGWLGNAVLHTVRWYELHNAWGYDPRVAATLRGFFGERSDVYKDVVAHMPEVSIVAHRALKTRMAARMSVPSEAGLETRFYMEEDGSQPANALELMNRWLPPVGSKPDVYAPATHRLAYNVAVKFGGRLVIASGEHGLVISGTGGDGLSAQRVAVPPPAEGKDNRVTISLPHTQPVVQAPPVLRIAR